MGLVQHETRGGAEGLQRCCMLDIMKNMFVISYKNREHDDADHMLLLVQCNCQSYTHDKRVCDRLQVLQGLPHYISRHGLMITKL